MAFPIPSMLLKQLYTRDSLKNTGGGVKFSLKNRLSDAKLTGLQSVKFDGREAPRSAITIQLDNGSVIHPDDLKNNPVDFPLRQSLDIVCAIEPLALGLHQIEIKFEATPFGSLTLKVEGSIVSTQETVVRLSLIHI